MARTVRPTKIRRTLDNVTAFPPSNNENVARKRKSVRAKARASAPMCQEVLLLYGRPIERFRNGIQEFGHCPILDLDTASGSNPAISGHVEQASPIDRLPPRFRHRRDAEFHPAG